MGVRIAAWDASTTPQHAIRIASHVGAPSRAKIRLLGTCIINDISPGKDTMSSRLPPPGYPSMPHAMCTCRMMEVTAKSWVLEKPTGHTCKVAYPTKKIPAHHTPLLKLGVSCVTSRRLMLPMFMLYLHKNHTPETPLTPTRNLEGGERLRTSDREGPIHIIS